MRADAKMARKPVLVAAITAMLGVAGMLLVNHGSWSKPKLTYPQVTTDAAAQTAGAKITPTVPESPIAPKPPGPALANPVDGQTR